ncbi:protein of unknown function DUF362 [Pirellula staleyi DSM 6068]|uniref:DUF362 domain-containing protein n=1 Tax=Pirellula staleyi (strain ATCC 27377 / DSM 6068 / ICPB 4128) TaxID=530564 RepID=D2R3G3_PIRSD|nr:DUF362 domain-containing protein [Pirellula staleyi]ADB15194.1 protein of unknown function DUF362 [Pirellula staleyi DSM 6068]
MKHASDSSASKSGKPSSADHAAKQAPMGTDITTPPVSRRLLLAGAACGVGLATLGIVKETLRERAPVFIAKNQRYDQGLETTIKEGLLAVGIAADSLRGKKVLIKPNLVEPTRDAPHVTTHPAMIVATAEVFRSFGATVGVGEGPGHVRDTEMVLTESGVGEYLAAAKLPFYDLNYEDVGWAKNRGRTCSLAGFYFPKPILEADIVVSLPKMKTHHWVGVTGAMKNLYGVIPGIKYGWPKNVLHHNGIPQTVYDINASLPKTIAIVDGIDCMEGDGPIMGSRKQMGLILVGLSPAAVDATMCRLMQLDPLEISYLQLAGGRLGPIRDRYITQRGEGWQGLAQPFAVLDRPHLRMLQRPIGALVS